MDEIRHRNVVPAEYVDGPCFLAVGDLDDHADAVAPRCEAVGAQDVHGRVQRLGRHVQLDL